MKNERFERYIYTGVTAILVLIAAVFVVFLFLERSAVFAFLGKVRFVLAPVIYGAVLAFLMSPVYNWCYRLTVYTGKSGEPKARFKNEKLGAFFGRSVGTAVSLVFLLAVIVSLSSMIIPQLYSSIVGIINMMPEYFQNVYDWLTDFFVNNPPVEQAILNIYGAVGPVFPELDGDRPDVESLELPEFPEYREDPRRCFQRCHESDHPDKKSADRADRHDISLKHQGIALGTGKEIYLFDPASEGGEHCSRRVPFYQKSVFRLYHRKTDRFPDHRNSLLYPDEPVQTPV